MGAPTEGNRMDIVLMPGLWLDSSAWDQVAAELRRLGHNPIAVPLPGTDDRSTSATLDDQIQAAVSAVDAADRPLVVSHSAACALAWIVADRRPDDISGVVLIGGFPSADGEQYAPYFELVDGVMPFPGWEPFEGPDSYDIDEETKKRMADEAIPVPAGVSHAVISLGDPRRYEVPVHMICPEFTPDDVKGWMAEGSLPELAATTNYSLIDFDSGHWPMYTKPVELAGALAEIADAAGSA